MVAASSLEWSLGSNTFYELGIHFGITLGDLGVTLGPSWAAMEPFWEHFGYTFCLPERVGSPKVPQEAHTPKFPHPFGTVVGVKKRKKLCPEAPQTESLKMRRKSVPKRCDFEILDHAKVWGSCPKSSVSAFEKK